MYLVLQFFVFSKGGGLSARSLWRRTGLHNDFQEVAIHEQIRQARVVAPLKRTQWPEEVQDVPGALLSQIIVQKGFACAHGQVTIAPGTSHGCNATNN